MCRCAVVLTACLAAASACSTSDSATTDPQPSATTTEATPDPTAVDDAAPTVPPGATAAEQLEALENDPNVSPLEVAIAEWSALVALLPGAIPVIADDSLLPTASHAFADLDENIDELTPEQREAFDAQFEILFDDALAIDSFWLFDDIESSTSDVPGDTEGLMRPVGFASPASPAPAGFRDAVRGVANSLRSALGGPPMKIWVEIHPEGSFGTDLASNLALASWNPSRLSLLALGEDVDCVMRLTDTDTTSAEMRGVIVHELVHCWQAYELGIATDPDTAILTQNAMDDWALEGMAAYYGEQIGGVTRFNSEWWGGYLSTRLDADNSWTAYSRTYDAIGLWSRIAEGSDIVAAMKAALAVAPDNTAMYAAATAGLGVGQSWIAAGAVQQPGWGAGWAAAGPGNPSTARPADRADFEVGAANVESVAAAMQRTTIWPVTGVVGAGGSVMTLFGDGAGVVRVGGGDLVIPPGETVQDRWCLGDCLCPDAPSPFPSNRTLPNEVELTSALLGLADRASSLLVEVEEFVVGDERWPCEEEPEPAPDLGDPSDGLVGTWLANPQSVAATLEQSSVLGTEGPALDVAGATGDVLLTFDADGTGRLSYVDVTYLLNDSIVGDLTISGTGTFAWGVTDGTIRISGISFSFEITSGALGGIPFTLTDADVPTGGVTGLDAIVTNNMLTITAADGSGGQVFFPNLWTRA